jgi:hypothetical protein
VKSIWFTSIGIASTTIIRGIAFAVRFRMTVTGGTEAQRKPAELDPAKSCSCVSHEPPNSSMAAKALQPGRRSFAAHATVVKEKLTQMMEARIVLYSVEYPLTMRGSRQYLTHRTVQLDPSHVDAGKDFVAMLVTRE